MPTPLDGAPPAQLTDYLPAGETTAWRTGVPAADLPALGAGDGRGSRRSPSAASLASGTGRSARRTSSTRSRTSRPTTIQAQVDALHQSSGYKMKDLIYAVYTSDDFVKF